MPLWSYKFIWKFLHLKLLCVCNGGAWKKIASFQVLLLTCPQQNRINTMNCRFKKKNNYGGWVLSLTVSQAQGSDKPVAFSWTIWILSALSGGFSCWGTPSVFLSSLMCSLVPLVLALLFWAYCSFLSSLKDIKVCIHLDTNQSNLLNVGLWLSVSLIKSW